MFANSNAASSFLLTLAMLFASACIAASSQYQNICEVPKEDQNLLRHIVDESAGKKFNKNKLYKELGIGKFSKEAIKEYEIDLSRYLMDDKVIYYLSALKGIPKKYFNKIKVIKLQCEKDINGNIDDYHIYSIMNENDIILESKILRSYNNYDPENRFYEFDVRSFGSIPRGNLARILEEIYVGKNLNRKTMIDTMREAGFRLHEFKFVDGKDTDCFVLDIKVNDYILSGNSILFYINYPPLIGGQNFNVCVKYKDGKKQSLSHF